MATAILSNHTDYDPEARPIRALALDGGGMRGHYTACVLDTVCRRFAATNRDGSHFSLGERFDLIVGASTGSIVAAGLAAGKSPLAVALLYRAWGGRIFQTRVPDFEAMRGLQQIAAFLLFMKKFARRPFNDDGPLRAALESLLGVETFGTMHARTGTALLLPAVNMATHKAWVFKTSHIPGKHRDENTPLVEACLASSAAPYFFPLAFYGAPFADGGLFANSPMLLAIIEAMEMTAEEPSRPIEIVSVGTCPPPVGDHASADTRRWGFEQWRVVRRLSETLLDVQVSSHEYMTRFLLPHLDRKITIFRLHQSTPNDAEARMLGIDRAEPEALDILERRARNDGEHVHSEAKAGGAAFDAIRAIFSDVAIQEA